MAVLGLLKEQDMHGYELKKRLSDVFGLASAVSFGSLYPALSRLEAAGAITVVGAGEGAEEGADAGTTTPEWRSRRRRKVYAITARGAAMFGELLASSQSGGEDERSFNLRLAFARYLPPEGRLGLLEQRRAVLGERLAQVAARARARRDDRYMRVLAERQQEALSRDVSWLDDLIEEERTSAAQGRPAETSASSGGAGAEAVLAAPTPQVGRLVPLASAAQLQRAGTRVTAPAATESNSPGPVKDGE